jgi:hypothetical protein
MKAAHAKKTKPLLPVDGKSSRAWDSQFFLDVTLG